MGRKTTERSIKYNQPRVKTDRTNVNNKRQNGVIHAINNPHLLKGVIAKKLIFDILKKSPNGLLMSQIFPLIRCSRRMATTYLNSMRTKEYNIKTRQSLINTRALIYYIE